MPVTYRIVPHHGLVIWRYCGHVTIAQIEQALRGCCADPGFRPDYRHFADMSEVTSFDPDYVGFLGLQAKAASLFWNDGGFPMFVYLTPWPVSRRMAALALKSWAAVPGAVQLTAETWVEALKMLGLDPAVLPDLRPV